MSLEKTQNDLIRFRLYLTQTHNRYTQNRLYKRSDTGFGKKPLVNIWKDYILNHTWSCFNLSRKQKLSCIEGLSIKNTALYILRRKSLYDYGFVGRNGNGMFRHTIFHVAPFKWNFGGNEGIQSHDSSIKNITALNISLKAWNILKSHLYENQT